MPTIWLRLKERQATITSSQQAETIRTPGHVWVLKNANERTAEFPHMHRVNPMKYLPNYGKAIKSSSLSDQTQ
jgi:hypothetical protein